MSYPNNYSWDNVRSDTNNQRNDVPLQLSNWQQFGTGYQPTWQQQNASVPLQPLQSQLQQQPNWNNNPMQKSTSLTPQMNYKEEKISWHNFSQQNQYLQQEQQQQPQHFQNQQQFGNNPNLYSYQGISNSPSSFSQNSNQQMNFSASNIASPDPWNWGWDESSSSSPAASFSTNNNAALESANKWNVSNSVEESFNPVQNYFQDENNFSGNQVSRQEIKYDPLDSCSNEINTQPNTESLNQNFYYDNNEKLLFNREKNNEVINIKQDVGNECLGDSLTVANVNEVNFGDDVGSNFNVKAEGCQSFNSNSASNVKEIKSERLSPDLTKTPLTAQALRDFCKDKYENGAIDSKSRSSTEGLTQQWSIESQISQDTASDDISPFMQEGSHSDMSTWDSTPGHQPTNDSSRESNVSLSPRLSVSNKDLNSSQNLIQDTSLNKNFHQRADENFITEERLTEQANQNIFSPPSLPVSFPPRSGENSSNPYSLNQKMLSKGSAQSRRVIQKETTSNFSGNEYTNMVKQLERCSVTDNSLNQQVISRNPQMGNRPISGQGPYKPNIWYQKKGGMEEELVNQETIPDNEERPDAEEYKMKEDSSGRYITKNSASPSNQNQSFPTGSDNQEVSCRPDRNQYLETGQLEDQLILNSTNDLTSDPLPPPGLSRLVTGEIQPNNNTVTTQNIPIDISSPPPGLDRMVLGQMTENESVPETDQNSFRRNRNTPPPGLHRMVPGQLTDNQGQRNAEVSNARLDDIPPPGFHRMIPGESSSPESPQNVIPIDTREQRVVTGVATDEIDVGTIQANISSSPAPANRLANQPSNTEENRLQFQSERCETIGSDNVDTYSSNPPDNSSKLGKRKEGKDRERLREDIPSDEFELDSSRRHDRDRDSDYYSKRERNREIEDSSPGDRYRDERERRLKGRERSDWDRERRKESPGRYREDKGRRKDYRDTKKRNKEYDYSDDEDEEDDEYYSDRERRNLSKYKDDYDRSYSRRDDRSRSVRPEKFSKDGSNDKNSGKNRRRDGYNERDRDVERERDRDRDRDRDRIRDRDRDRDRSRKERDRPREYYRRREDTDDYSQRSRPSSRNDSIQDYKHRPTRSDYDGERDREKDHYRGHSKRERDMFYAPGYNYDTAYYNYYYQYYENLRRTNPGAYAEWFRKFYAHSQQGTFDGTYTEDRGSVHSGRSSANEENKDRCIKSEADFVYGYSYQSFATDQNYPYHSHSSDTNDHDAGRRIDSSLQMESIQRLTPEKFTTAHVKGILTSRGQLIKILPHYPLDGQPATLEIYENLNCFEDAKKDFLNFPGPLVKGVTHKNNILRFCKQKIKDADSNPDIFDKDSYKLIWELLILMIRQNGTIAGTDIAELLMTNRTTHVNRQSSASHANLTENDCQPTLSEEEVTNQFRDYLIYGNSKEALEWAMKHGLWGHALFLASKMDQRTYASVMTRFANGLTMNDPLQTLYQLMSGRQPASVTCCADEKWGDWRPHLAMILSNSTARPDLDVKAVTTLGDTLGLRGNLYAAHFCYLMAQVEFGTFAQKSSKIVLIGSAHTLPFQQFSNNEAIFATEIFEFACSLADPDFALHHFQIYKLLMAKRLTEIGLAQEAVHYVEVIAKTITKFPAHYPPYFIQEVYNLGNMLKFFDPIYNSEGNFDDPEWLLHLLNILNDYHTGVLQHDGIGSASNLTTYSENDGVQNLPLDSITNDSLGNEVQSWQNQQQLYYDQSQQIQQQNQQQQWYQNDQTGSGYQQNSKGFVPMEQPPSASSDNANPYWTNQNQWLQPQNNHESGYVPQTNENDYLSGVGVDTSDSNKNNSNSHYNYFDPNRNEDPGSQSLQGKVTLPNNRSRTISRSSEGDNSGQPKSRSTKKEPSKHNQSTGSWFGGIWNKLPFRPKNQMILPDDKNPSIVWDSDKNRWVNLNSDEDDATSSIPPPPKASELASPTIPLPKSASTTAIPNPMSPFSSNPVSNAEHSDHPDSSLPPSGPNKYKMARGKSLRSNYVDVLNPGAASKPSSSPVPAPNLFPTVNYSSQAPTNYFIPAPVEGNENATSDFLSQSNAPVLGKNSDNLDSTQPQQQALSRWSSTSSLSREVQKYTMKRVGQTKEVHNPSDSYYGNQWIAPPGPSSNIRNSNQTSTLPRSKGYPK